MNTKTMASVIITAIFIYLLYPNYEAGKLFMDYLPPIFWLIFSLMMGVLTYFLIENQNLLTAVQEFRESIDSPFNVLEKYDNSPERALNPKPYKILSWIKLKTDYVFSLDFEGKKMYLIANGIKGQPLNPSLISEYELSKIGFSSVSRYRMDDKSRLLHDLISTGSSMRDIESLNRMNKTEGEF